MDNSLENQLLEAMDGLADNVTRYEHIRSAAKDCAVISRAYAAKFAEWCGKGYQLHFLGNNRDITAWIGHLNDGNIGEITTEELILKFDSETLKNSK